MAQRTDDEDVRARLALMQDRLVGSLTLPIDRIQEAADDAVRRGRMTRKDAEELVQSLMSAGRSQTEQLVADLEQVLSIGSGARRKVTRSGERVVREAARLAVAPLGASSFPIVGYEDLTAAQVTGRLKGLTPAELRKVRDYEARNANRKSVLGAADRALK